MENVENPKAPIKPHFFACQSVGRSVERLAKTGWTFVDKSDSAFSVIFSPHLAGRVFLAVSTPFPRVFHARGNDGGDATRDAGAFLEESPQPQKNLNKWFVGEDIILPKTMLLRETRETFLEESFPNPSKNLLTGYRSNVLYG